MTGHVLAPNGAPVPGARVGIGERVVTTALDGSYEHRITGESAPSYGHALWAASPPYETILVRNFGAELLAEEDRTVNRELTFRGEALELGGRVVDAAGEPVESCSVYISHQDGLLGMQSAEELALPEDRETLGLGVARLRVWSRMPLQHALKDGDPIVDVGLVVARLCEFQLELSGERASASSLQVLDGSGTPLEVWQFGGGENSGSITRVIEESRTPVLSVAESAATLVLMRRGQELTRMPLVLRPGEVNRIRWKSSIGRT